MGSMMGVALVGALVVALVDDALDSPPYLDQMATMVAVRPWNCWPNLMGVWVCAAQFATSDRQCGRA